MKKREKWEQKVLDDGAWTVKKAQFFESPDGGGFNCDLYMGGKLALHVFDGGYGGGCQYCGSPKTAKHGDWRANEAEFSAYVENLPREEPTDLFPEGLPPNMDMVVEFLATREHEVRRVKRMMRKRVFYLDKQDGQVYSVKFRNEVNEGHLRVVNAKYAPERILGTPEEIVDHIL